MKAPEILIVEDAGMIADYMKLILSRHGFRIAGVATSGEEAVAATLRTHPDLVLMDIRIDGAIDGIAAAEIIRAWSDIPILYVTAYTDSEVVARAMRTGGSGYLSKPFKGIELLGTIRSVLNHAEGKRQAGRNPAVGGQG